MHAGKTSLSVVVLLGFTRFKLLNSVLASCFVARGGCAFFTNALVVRSSPHHPTRRTRAAFLPTATSRFRVSSSLLSTSSSPAVAEKDYEYDVLDRVMRFRGQVDAGYGRGGKKLGVPTANLPESQFASALRDVRTGVYVGWALVEGGGGGGRNVVHRAVVNVGYSPTFAGAENPEKIVEAHLIADENEIEGDFYDETMRLSLSGFLRDEKKFDSFPDLVAQINRDIANAKDALSTIPYFVDLKNDPFFAFDGKSGTWVGSDGGDGTASFEFVDKETVMNEIR